MSEDDAPQTPGGPVAGQRVRHGTGVHSNRAFPTNNHPDHLDPFVLFERFYIDPDQGFPMHPHQGFEIVSYMLDGGMDHEDSLGVAKTASEGDAMRITTGSGIRHSEFPAGNRDCNGLQLWVKLPHDQMDADPDYADATSADLPTEDRAGATVTTVVGDDSPLDLHTPMEYLDVSVTDTWEWTIPDDWTGFVYGVAGDGTAAGEPFGVGDVLTLTDADTVELRAESAFRVVAVAGRPHGDPIRQRGPLVL